MLIKHRSRGARSSRFLLPRQVSAKDFNCFCTLTLSPTYSQNHLVVNYDYYGGVKVARWSFFAPLAPHFSMLFFTLTTLALGLGFGL
jgi:hypothetical protein